ncbi:MAG: hypothetical protein HFJ45_03525 [Clostridia bacterium]|nr:hypothetical protein [Clostridia bacterium]
MENLEELSGKYFSILEEDDMNILIYQINRTENSSEKNLPKYTIEKLECAVEYRGINKKRTFFVDNLAPDGNHLIIFDFKQDKIVVNIGFLDYNSVKVIKKNILIDTQILYSENEVVYKEFYYTSDMKRQIAIIDLETIEEVKPTLYIDPETDTIKGKCRLELGKKYFLFKIDDKNNGI